MTTRRTALQRIALVASTSGLPAKSAATSKLVGILSEAGPTKAGLDWEPDFWRVMEQRGWTLGQNVAVERAFSNAKSEHLPQLADELVRKRVDVIICVANDQEAMVAAARATRTVPIVVFDAFDPVEQGLIETFARPGHNVTGVALTAAADFDVKRLEFLRAIAPSAKRLCWLRSSRTSFASRVDGTRFDTGRSFVATAQKIGFETRSFHAPSAGDIDTAFKDAVTWGAQAVTIGRGWPLASTQQQVAQLALHHRLPSAFLGSGFVQAGGLLSYSVPESEFELTVLRCIDYVDRILRGADPASMPVVGPDRYELTINTRTAEVLGLTIPPSILVRADRLVR